MALLSEFKIEVPLQMQWAYGCDSCQFGLILAPALIGHVSVSEQRAIAHVDGLLLYCECQAGHMYRQHLRKVADTLNEWQRNRIRGYLALANVPTVHGA